MSSKSILKVTNHAEINKMLSSVKFDKIHDRAR